MQIICIRNTWYHLTICKKLKKQPYKKNVNINILCVWFPNLLAENNPNAVVNIIHVNWIIYTEKFIKIQLMTASSENLLQEEYQR